jgi:hypothetical protein
MKHLLLTTIAAVVLVGCGPSVDIWTAAEDGNIEVVEKHIAAGTGLDAKMQGRNTPLLYATSSGHREIDERLEEYALVQLDVLRSFLSNMKNGSETVVNRIYPGSRISVKMIAPPGRRPYC